MRARKRVERECAIDAIVFRERELAAAAAAASFKNVQRKNEKFPVDLFQKRNVNKKSTRPTAQGFPSENRENSIAAAVAIAAARNFKKERKQLKKIESPLSCKERRKKAQEKIK